jgi:hypothetical protein
MNNIYRVEEAGGGGLAGKYSVAFNKCATIAPYFIFWLYIMRSQSESGSQRRESSRAQSERTSSSATMFKTTAITLLTLPMEEDYPGKEGQTTEELLGSILQQNNQI